MEFLENPHEAGPKPIPLKARTETHYDKMEVGHVRVNALRGCGAALQLQPQ